MLNPGGHLRGDGRPDLASVVDDPDPVGVWAYNTGGDHDIAFSEWDGSQWTATEFLTFGTEDELNPRVFVESDGTVHVVWWVAGTQQIRLVTRAAGSSTWSMPEQVTAGRRPSAAVFNGVTYVAYERDSGAPGMAQDIVVARQDGPSSWSFSTIASTPRTEQLDPILHAEQGKLWLDWMHDTAAFGCAVWTEPGWYAMPNELWADSGWVGVESARKTIRGQMMD